MKIAIIFLALTLVCFLAGQAYKLHFLQNRVSCLQEMVENEYYLARYNALTVNRNTRLNDKNIETINENFRRLEKILNLP